MAAISIRTKQLPRGCFSASSTQHLGMNANTIQQYTTRIGKRAVSERVACHRLMSVCGLGTEIAPHQRREKPRSLLPGLIFTANKRGRKRKIIENADKAVAPTNLVSLRLSDVESYQC